MHLSVGDRVRHPAKSDWGVGQIMDLDSSKAVVFFVEAGSKTLSLQATYFPFLLDPDRHQFIKPTYTKNAAAICAFDIDYTPRLGWPAYERMLRFSDYLKSELASRSLKPRDNIDVQSFMWAIAQG